ncbi:unnamed protein product [Gordionus sp. m RMFG-2023]
MFKLESYLTPWLFSYLNNYIKNLKPEDVKFSLLGGQVRLSNLDLKLDALQREINFPIKLLNGHVHELTVSIPYTSLSTDSIIISLNLLEFTFKISDSIEPQIVNEALNSAGMNNFDNPDKISNNIFKQEEIKNLFDSFQKLVLEHNKDNAQLNIFTNTPLLSSSDNPNKPSPNFNTPTVIKNKGLHSNNLILDSLRDNDFIDNFQNQQSPPYDNVSQTIDENYPNNFMNNLNVKPTKSWWSNILGNVKYYFNNIVIKYVESSDDYGSEELKQHSSDLSSDDKLVYKLVFTSHIKRAEYGNFALTTSLHEGFDFSFPKSNFYSSVEHIAGSFFSSIETSDNETSPCATLRRDKILQIHDLSLSLDCILTKNTDKIPYKVGKDIKVPGFGGADFYDVFKMGLNNFHHPIVRKCDVTLFFCYKDVLSYDKVSVRPSLTTYVGIKDLDISLSDHQIPLVIRLIELCTAVIKGDLDEIAGDDSDDQLSINSKDHSYAAYNQSNISGGGNWMDWASFIFLEDQNEASLEGATDEIANNEARLMQQFNRQNQEQVKQIALNVSNVKRDHKVLFTVDNLTLTLKAFSVQNVATESKPNPVKIKCVPYLTAKANNMVVRFENLRPLMSDKISPYQRIPMGNRGISLVTSLSNAHFGLIEDNNQSIIFKTMSNDVEVQNSATFPTGELIEFCKRDWHPIEIADEFDRNVSFRFTYRSFDREFNGDSHMDKDGGDGADMTETTSYDFSFPIPLTITFAPQFQRLIFRAYSNYLALNSRPPFFPPYSLPVVPLPQLKNLKLKFDLKRADITLNTYDFGAGLYKNGYNDSEGKIDPDDPTKKGIAEVFEKGIRSSNHVNDTYCDSHGCDLKILLIGYQLTRETTSVTNVAHFFETTWSMLSDDVVLEIGTMISGNLMAFRLKDLKSDWINCKLHLYGNANHDASSSAERKSNIYLATYESQKVHCILTEFGMDYLMRNDSNECRECKVLHVCSLESPCQSFSKTSEVGVTGSKSLELKYEKFFDQNVSGLKYLANLSFTIKCVCQSSIIPESQIETENDGLLLPCVFKATLTCDRDALNISCVFDRHLEMNIYLDKIHSMYWAVDMFRDFCLNFKSALHRSLPGDKTNYVTNDTKLDFLGQSKPDVFNWELNIPGFTLNLKTRVFDRIDASILHGTAVFVRVNHYRSIDMKVGDFWIHYSSSCNEKERANHTLASSVNSSKDKNRNLLELSIIKRVKTLGKPLQKRDTSTYYELIIKTRKLLSVNICLPMLFRQLRCVAANKMANPREFRLVKRNVVIDNNPNLLHFWGHELLVEKIDMETGFALNLSVHHNLQEPDVFSNKTVHENISSDVPIGIDLEISSLKVASRLIDKFAYNSNGDIDLEMTVKDIRVSAFYHSNSRFNRLESSSSLVLSLNVLRLNLTSITRYSKYPKDTEYLEYFLSAVCGHTEFLSDNVDIKRGDSRSIDNANLNPSTFLVILDGQTRALLECYTLLVDISRALSDCLSDNGDETRFIEQNTLFNCVPFEVYLIGIRPDISEKTKPRPKLIYKVFVPNFYLQLPVPATSLDNTQASFHLDIENLNLNSSKKFTRITCERLTLVLNTIPLLNCQVRGDSRISMNPKGDHSDVFSSPFALSFDYRISTDSAHHLTAQINSPLKINIDSFALDTISNCAISLIPQLYPLSNFYEMQSSNDQFNVTTLPNKLDVSVERIDLVFSFSKRDYAPAKTIPKSINSGFDFVSVTLFHMRFSGNRIEPAALKIFSSLNISTLRVALLKISTSMSCPTLQQQSTPLRNLKLFALVSNLSCQRMRPQDIPIFFADRDPLSLETTDDDSAKFLDNTHHYNVDKINFIYDDSVGTGKSKLNYKPKHVSRVILNPPQNVIRGNDGMEEGCRAKIRLSVGRADFKFGQEHYAVLKGLHKVLTKALKQWQTLVAKLKSNSSYGEIHNLLDRGKENAIPTQVPKNILADLFQFKDDLRDEKNGFSYITKEAQKKESSECDLDKSYDTTNYAVDERMLTPKVLEIVFDEDLKGFAENGGARVEAISSMCWRYPEPRYLSMVRINPLPFCMEYFDVPSLEKLTSSSQSKMAATQIDTGDRNLAITLKIEYFASGIPKLPGKNSDSSGEGNYITWVEFDITDSLINNHQYPQAKAHNAKDNHCFLTTHHHQRVTDNIDFGHSAPVILYCGQLIDLNNGSCESHLINAEIWKASVKIISLHATFSEPDFKPKFTRYSLSPLALAGSFTLDSVYPLTLNTSREYLNVNENCSDWSEMDFTVERLNLSLADHSLNPKRWSNKYLGFERGERFLKDIGLAEQIDVLEIQCKNTTLKHGFVSRDISIDLIDVFIRSFDNTHKLPIFESKGFALNYSSDSSGFGRDDIAVSTNVMNSSSGSLKKNQSQQNTPHEPSVRFILSPQAFHSLMRYWEAWKIWRDTSYGSLDITLYADQAKLVSIIPYSLIITNFSSLTLWIKSPDASLVGSDKNLRANGSPCLYAANATTTKIKKLRAYTSISYACHEKSDLLISHDRTLWVRANLIIRNVRATTNNNGTRGNTKSSDSSSDEAFIQNDSHFIFRTKFLTENLTQIMIFSNTTIANFTPFKFELYFSATAENVTCRENSDNKLENSVICYPNGVVSTLVKDVMVTKNYVNIFANDSKGNRELVENVHLTDANFRNGKMTRILHLTTHGAISRHVSLTILSHYNVNSKYHLHLLTFGPPFLIDFPLRNFITSALNTHKSGGDDRSTPYDASQTTADCHNFSDKIYIRPAIEYLNESSKDKAPNSTHDLAKEENDTRECGWEEVGWPDSFPLIPVYSIDPEKITNSQCGKKNNLGTSSPHTLEISLSIPNGNSLFSLPSHIFCDTHFDPDDLIVDNERNDKTIDADPIFRNSRFATQFIIVLNGGILGLFPVSLSGKDKFLPIDAYNSDAFFPERCQEYLEWVTPHDLIARSGDLARSYPLYTSPSSLSMISEPYQCSMSHSLYFDKIQSFDERIGKKEASSEILIKDILRNDSRSGNNNETSKESSYSNNGVNPFSLNSGMERAKSMLENDHKLILKANVKSDYSLPFPLLYLRLSPDTLMINDTDTDLFVLSAYSGSMRKLPAKRCLSIVVDGETETGMDCAFFKIGYRDSHTDPSADHIYFSGSLMLCLNDNEEEESEIGGKITLGGSENVKGVLRNNGFTHLEILLNGDKVYHLTLVSTRLSRGTRLISLKCKYRFNLTLGVPLFRNPDLPRKCSNSPSANTIDNHDDFRDNLTSDLLGLQCALIKPHLITQNAFQLLDNTKIEAVSYVALTTHQGDKNLKYPNATAQLGIIDSIDNGLNSTDSSHGFINCVDLLIKLTKFLDNEGNGVNHLAPIFMGRAIAVRIFDLTKSYNLDEPFCIDDDVPRVVRKRVSFPIPISSKPSDDLSDTSDGSIERILGELNDDDLAGHGLCIISTDIPPLNSHLVHSKKNSSKSRLFKGAVQYFTLVRDPLIPYTIFNQNNWGLMVFHSLNLDVNPFRQASNLNKLLFNLFTSLDSFETNKPKRGEMAYEIFHVTPFSYLSYEPLSSHLSSLTQQNEATLLRDTRHFFWFGFQQVRQHKNEATINDTGKWSWTSDPLILSPARRETLPVPKTFDLLHLSPRSIGSVAVNLDFSFPCSRLYVSYISPNVEPPFPNLSKELGTKFSDSRPSYSVSFKANSLELCLVEQQPPIRLNTIGTYSPYCYYNLREVLVLRVGNLSSLYDVDRSHRRGKINLSGLIVQNGLLCGKLLVNSITCLNLCATMIDPDSKPVLMDKLFETDDKGMSHSSNINGFEFPVILKSVPRQYNLTDRRGKDGETNMIHANDIENDFDVSLECSFCRYDYFFPTRRSEDGDTIKNVDNITSNVTAFEFVTINVPGVLSIAWEDKFWLTFTNSYLSQYDRFPLEHQVFHFRLPTNDQTGKTTDCSRNLLNFENDLSDYPSKIPANYSRGDHPDFDKLYNHSFKRNLFDPTSYSIISRFEVSRLYLELTLRLHLGGLYLSSSRDAPFSLTKFVYGSVGGKDVGECARDVLKQIAKRYARDLYGNAAWIIGSLDLIGSPAFLVTSLKDAFSREFNQPKNQNQVSLLTDNVPTKIIRALTTSLLVSMVNFCQSLSRNLDIISFDSDHIEYQTQRRLNRRMSECILTPNHLSSHTPNFQNSSKYSRHLTNLDPEGFSNLGTTSVGKAKRDLIHGFTGLGFSIIAALAGIIDVPFKELQSILKTNSLTNYAQSTLDLSSSPATYTDPYLIHQHIIGNNNRTITPIAKSLVTGVGKGLIGAIIKPLGGFSEFLASSAQSILSLIGGDTLETLLRNPIIYMIECDVENNLDIAQHWLEINGCQLDPEKCQLVSDFLYSDQDPPAFGAQSNSNHGSQNLIGYYFVLLTLPSAFSSSHSSCHHQFPKKSGRFETSGNFYLFKLPQPGILPFKVFHLYELKSECLDEPGSIVSISAFDENAFLKDLNSYEDGDQRDSILRTLKYDASSVWLKNYLRNAPNASTYYGPMCSLKFKNPVLAAYWNNIFNEAISQCLEP